MTSSRLFKFPHTFHFSLGGFANVHGKSDGIVYCFRSTEVMSHSDDSFELDRLVTVIPSQDVIFFIFTAPFHPLKHLKMLKNS